MLARTQKMELLGNELVSAILQSVVDGIMVPQISRDASVVSSKIPILRFSLGPSFNLTA